MVKLTKLLEFQSNEIPNPVFEVQYAAMRKVGGKNVFRIGLVDADRNTFIVIAERSKMKELARNRFFNPGSIIQLDQWSKDADGCHWLESATGIKSATPEWPPIQTTPVSSASNVPSGTSTSTPKMQMHFTKSQEQVLKELNVEAAKSDEEDVSKGSDANVWNSFNEVQQQMLLSLGASKEDYCKKDKKDDDTDTAAVLVGQFSSDLAIIDDSK